MTGTDGKWSPDGRQLVFAKGENVYLAKADGTDARKLFTLPNVPASSSRIFGFLPIALEFGSMSGKTIQGRFGRFERTAPIFIPCCRAGGIRLLNAAAYGHPTVVIFSS